MPKMKSKRGASKRFKATASGKIKRRKGWKSHLLEWKSPKRRRRLRQSALVSKEDARRIRRLLPYL
ncbi:MAG: 50S ribosomal protein L35 [Candidatus Rokubacteria bacterium RIFCSPLOWO2_12_FULL_69_21]|jgi:large subunit ribosomal protein L35|nr:MAG: 50S ribosomal protein L35, large subunit ribosomal protein L35 [Candidatus Rokubacteria bacterium CSP1-6]OGL32083.1 MAG: 50S ribosomal protein L35 [Candidatus Rokubacteria bacterium RIFCSPLOWO2_12_FULL_69_21]